MAKVKQEIFWKNPGYKVRPKLTKDIECDYLIVGGGITGVSLAYFLAKNKVKNIVLIEKNIIGSGATGKSAGFLALKGELDLQQIIKSYGKNKGMIYWNGNKEGLKLVNDIIKKEKIDCDFEPQNTIYGSVVQGKIDKKQEIGVLEEYIIEKEIERKSELITGQELKKEINTPLFLYALKSYNHGASLNPLKFVQGFSNIIEKNGVKIFENTQMLDIKNNVASTTEGKIKFKKIIIATDLGIRDKRIKSIRSTITISSKLSNSLLKKLSLLKHKLVWDSLAVYHYLKITKDNRILLGFGDKLAKKNSSYELHAPHLERIKTFYKKLFPNSNIKIEYAWSGNFGATNDRIPIIETKGNRITVGGASSQVVCVMTAKHLADKILNKKHYLDEFFKHVKRTPHEFGLFHFLNPKKQPSNFKK